MATPEPYPYRKLNYPINNLEQNFTQEQKLQTRSNIGIPSSVDEEGKVLMVDNDAGGLVWADAPNGLPDIASGDEGKVLSVENGEPAWTDVDIPEQVNADWDATSGVSEILHKPNLATVATTGNYSDLQNLPTIPAAQVNSDWTATSGISEILHKPTTKRVVAGANVTITETADTFEISAPSFAQEPADWDATSGVSEILNKPDLSIYAETANLATVATTGSYDDLVNKPAIPQAQVNSDWNASSGVTEILNKPNLSTVATTGDYNDLVNQPSIPAAQVNADWTSSSGVSEILNKPTLAAVATSGDYSDLSNTPSIPTATSDLTNDSGYITLSDVPAQVNADWDASSGVSAILNKPTIPSPYTAGNGIAVTNNVISAKVDGTTIDTNASGELTVIGGGGGGSQVNADWDATSGIAEILNKPTPKTLTAGTGISIADGVSSVTISSTVTVPVQDVTVDGNSVVSNGVAAITSPTVDQTYDASSTNAQSGTAVAGAIGSLPTNLTSAQIQAFKEALGVDETVLWSNTSGAQIKNGITLSEAFTNFEELKFVVSSNTTNGTPTVTYVPVMAPYTTSNVICLFFTNGHGLNDNFKLNWKWKMTVTNSGTTLTLTLSQYWGQNGTSWTQGDNVNDATVYKIVGIHRIASN